MRRQFVEVDDNGFVVEIHAVETKGNKGDQAKEPKTPINKRKASHTLHLSQSANKGDKLVNGQLLRPLAKRAK